MRFFAIAVIIFLCATSLASDARAQSNYGPVPNWLPMQNWQPDYFSFNCNIYVNDYSIQKFPTGCLTPSFKAAVEYELIDTLYQFEQKNFPHPNNFVPAVDHPDGYKAIYIFRHPKNYLWAEARSNGCRPDARKTIAVSPFFIANTGPGYARPSLKFALGHEFMHVVQFSIPGFLKPGRNNYDRLGNIDSKTKTTCTPPMWVREGIADAVAIVLARESYPSYWPPQPQFRNSYAWIGLRRFDVPLHFENFTRVRYKYRASAFWRHLSEVYFRNNLTFMEKWLHKAAPTLANGDEDWLAWLETRLKNSSIKAGLFHVYPGFLTAHAAQSLGKKDARHFAPKSYERFSFGGCPEVTVSGASPHATIKLKVAAIAGRCFRVKVQGFAPGETTHLQVHATSADVGKVDDLHLGLVDTTDKSAFNCARRMKKLIAKSQGCVISEFLTDNKLGTRVWKSVGLQHGNNPSSKLGLGQIAGNTTGYEAVFMLANVPKVPTEEKYSRFDLNDVEVTLEIGVSTEKLSMNGSGKKDTVGAMGVRPVGDATNLPPHVGFVNAGPVRDFIGSNLMSQADALSVQVQQTLPRNWGGVEGQALFSVAGAEFKQITPQNEIRDYEFEVGDSITVNLSKPLPPNATGTFEGHISGESADRSIIYFSKEPARVTVQENSHNVFKASASGKVCAEPIAALKTGQAKCKTTIQIEASIIRPFAHLYRPGTVVNNVNTQGTKLYNERKKQIIANLLAVTGGGTQNPSSSNPTGQSSGSAGALLCDCSCGLPRAPACYSQCLANWGTCP